MRVWRTRDAYLAEHGGDFVVVSPEGLVVRWLESREDSVEDELWHCQYLVVGGCLYQRTTVRGPYGTKSDDQSILDGLAPIEDRRVTALIETALDADQSAREQQQRRAQQAGDARVAAIVGDLRDAQLGPELLRARDALAARVRAYDDALAGRLLGTLVSVVIARPGSAVETAYARGCLAACFQWADDEGDHRSSGALPSEPRASLAAELALRSAELERDADFNDYIDAPRNATAYRRAAMAIREAARLVGDDA